MSTSKAALVATLATLIITSLLFGQISPRLPATTDANEWEIVSQRVAAGAAGGSSVFSGERVRGEVYLYNKRTGKVYLHFTGCTSNGRELDGGCFAPLAMFSDDEDVLVTPTPTNSRNGRTY